MGRVDVDNKSASVHNIQFGLRQNQKLESFSLHQCAKKGRRRFQKDGVLNFTPGLNKFTVAKYICNPFKFVLPLEIIPNMSINLSTRTFKIRVYVRPVEVAGQFLNIRGLILKLHFPSYITGSSL
mmetsp:Transcript_2995/g.2476  ORF Transcript_2995/g.2476 Transcript_2995/m.2476 type:complete len:125 (+) Transcript_2995:737-1111(+)